MSRETFRDRVPVRDRGECPVCGGVVRANRRDDLWTCDDCARRLRDNEVVR